MASFFSLPAEVRIQIYSYLLPGRGQYPSAYSGLRNSCRLIRMEYDHEAEKVIPHTYDHPSLRLGTLWYISHKTHDPRTMLDISCVELQPKPVDMSRLVLFPRNMIPWHWPWVKTQVISFDMSWEFTYLNELYDRDHDNKEGRESVIVGGYPFYPVRGGILKDPAHWIIHSAVRIVFERMDKIIKDRTGRTVRRRTFMPSDRRPRKCEIDTFVMRLVNFPEKPTIPPPAVLPPKAGLPSNHDRLWDVSFGFNSDGGFVEAVWRRRTQSDAQRDAENDFMPLHEWLAPVPQEPLDPLEEIGAPDRRVKSPWFVEHFIKH